MGNSNPQLRHSQCSRRDDVAEHPVCLAPGAVIFSAEVKDVDGDGLPDGIEDAVGGLNKDANGDPLPNLSAMGASSLQRDILIEMDAMIAGAGTSYGSSTAPFSAAESIVTLTDNNGHHHKPSAAALKIVIDIYLHAPVPIIPHIDIGNPADYISALGSTYAPRIHGSQPLGRLSPRRSQ
jgi:hypothetical protein